MSEVQNEANSSTSATSACASLEDKGSSSRMICYIWGSVDWEQPLNVNNNLILNWPVAFTALNDLNITIKQVSCGLKHTLVLSEDGQVFCFGNNAKGQLGLDISKFPYSYAPVKVELPDKNHVVEISCGGSHTLLRSEDGKIWSFGANLNGQLGRLPRSKPVSDKPGRVLGVLEFMKSSQIAAGGETSYAVTDTGDLFAWGSIQYGALGLGYNGIRLEKAGKETIDDVENPTLVVWFREQNIKIKKITAGAKHLVVLGENGNLYTCGYGAYGRLGLGLDNHDKLLPVQITLPIQKQQILDIISSSTSEHTLCMARVGGQEGRPTHIYVYFWGRPGNDQDGVTKPITVDSICGQGVNFVATGKGMSMCCTESGEAAIWGENPLNSCLGLLGDQKNKRVEPKVLEVLGEKHALRVYCGGWHMMAFTNTSQSTNPAVPLEIPEKGRVVKTGGFVSKARPFEELRELFYKKCSGTAETSTSASAEVGAGSAKVGKKRSTDEKQACKKRAK